MTRANRIMLGAAAISAVLVMALSLSDAEPTGILRLFGMGLITWAVLVLVGGLLHRTMGSDADHFDAIREQLAHITPTDGDSHPIVLPRVRGDGAATPLAHQLNLTLGAITTRLERAERRVGEQQAVLSAMRDGVMAIDRSDQVILLNPVARRLFSLSGIGEGGQSLQQVVRHPDLLKLVAQVARERRLTQDELALDRDGESRRLAVTASPVAGGGVVLVMADVTRIRELETLRVDFASNVSHELKTPITAIKGAVATLLDGAADDPEPRGRFLDMVQRHADRLERLVSDTLSLSRVERQVEAGNTPLVPAPIRPILEAAADACEAQQATAGVTLSITCDANLMAAMDAPMLEQAVVNLLGNAIGHSPKGEQVTLTAQTAGPGNGKSVQIRVGDHGPGIDPRHHSRLFERFYRVDAGRASSQGGTGLGLAIVKHVALAHGGQVSVESAQGHGSTFTIHLPVV